MQIFRREHFGGILYDTDSLRFKLLPDFCTSAEKIIDKKLPERRDILSAPIRAYFEITRKCNLVCKHCFVSSGPDNHEGLSLHNLERIIDELDDEGVIDIRFTGGEPTIRKDWFDIVSYAKNKGFSISLNTNAIYSNLDDVVNKLAKLSLEQVTVSIDGLEENHDYMRGKGAFKKMMKSVETMAKAGIKLRFNTVITKRNVNDVPALVALADKHVREINFFYMRPMGRALNENKSSLDFEEHYRSAKETLALREKYPKLSIMHFEQAFIERSILQEGNLGALRLALPYGNTTICIASDGSVWPHGYSPYQTNILKLGLLGKDSLKDIWTKSEKLDGLRTWYRELLGRCQECNEYMSRCAGLNFEMEISRLCKEININPFCLNEKPIPQLFGKYI